MKKGGRYERQGIRPNRRDDFRSLRPRRPQRFLITEFETGMITASPSRTADPIAQAIHRAQQNLLRLQQPEGFWCGELIVDSTLCSDYVLYMHWSGKLDPVLQEKCVAHIRRRQLPDGGWNIYEGGPSEINATVKAYFALKLGGELTRDTVDARCPRRGAAAGGHPAHEHLCQALSRFVLGQFPWKHLPAIPVELILLPDWLFFNIYEMSSWSRGHAHAAGHSEPPEANPPAARGKAFARALSRGPGAHGSLYGAGGKVLLAAKFFHLGHGDSFVYSSLPAMSWLREAALEAGGDLDDGSHGRRLGWAGRGFPRDAEFHYGAAGAGAAG